MLHVEYPLRPSPPRKRCSTCVQIPAVSGYARLPLAWTFPLPSTPSQSLRRIIRPSPSALLATNRKKMGKWNCFPFASCEKRRSTTSPFFIGVKEKKSHYAWIKSLSRLLEDQTKYNGRKFICERCFHGFI